MYYIGIDIGTTGCKSMVFDKNGAVMGQAYIEYPLIITSKQEIEQDARLWWKLSCHAVRSAVIDSGVNINFIKALSVASQGISFVPVDREINVLYNAISWLDIRASEQVKKINERYSEEQIFNITGKRITEAYTLPKIMWLMDNKPDIFKTTYKILMAHDYLIAKMTGEFVTDHTMAGGTMFYDIKEGRWSAELLDAFGICDDILPRIKYSGSPAGYLLAEAALEMGLCEGVLVAVGGQDQKVAAFAVSPKTSEATLSLGTAGAMEFISTAPLFDSGMHLPVFPYITPNIWTLEAVISTTGACVKWLKNTLFPHLTFKQLDELCEISPPGAKGTIFYPHLEGATSPHWNSSVMGALAGITLDTIPADIIRAVLEGIAYEIKSNLIAFESLSSEKIETIIAFGGGTSSRIWCNIICNITGKRVVVYSSPELVNIGAAKLACISTGAENNFGQEFLNKIIEFKPDKTINESYNQLYEDYLARSDSRL